MHKLLLILFLAIHTTSFAQSKEETLTWLKSNQERLLPELACNEINGSDTARFRLAVDGDSLRYAIDYDGTERWAVALRDLLYQEPRAVVVSKTPYYDACPDLISFILQTAPDKTRSVRVGTTGVTISGTDSLLSIIFNKKRKEEALSVIQAIMQLAKASGAKAVK